MQTPMRARVHPVDLFLEDPTEPHLVLAAVNVEDTILLRRRAPAAVDVPAGLGLEVQVLFRIEESSRQREHWSFLLELWLDGDPLPPAFAGWSDRWGLFDDRQGVVARRLPALGGGVHELVFRVRVDHERQPWGNPGGAATTTRELQGTIDLHA